MVEWKASGYLDGEKDDHNEYDMPADVEVTIRTMADLRKKQHVTQWVRRWVSDATPATSHGRPVTVRLCEDRRTVHATMVQGSP